MIITPRPVYDGIVEGLEPFEHHTDENIEEILSILSDRAHAHGHERDAQVKAEGGSGAPFAYQATTNWKAVEIIVQLEKQVEELQRALNCAKAELEQELS
jgi:hypothetical protein